MIICKTFDFDAAHFLPLVPEGHKCRRLHGHTYRCSIRCEGLLDARGFVVDYAEIGAAWTAIHDALDHRLLNDVMPNPTTENVVMWIAERLAALPVCSVRLYESASSYAHFDLSGTGSKPGGWVRG